MFLPLYRPTGAERVALVSTRPSASSDGVLVTVAKGASRTKLNDAQVYGPMSETEAQTVFAREAGAVAAPTAGLHFTPELLARVPHAFVTLHVGVGTFRSVLVENLAEHRMHSERFSVSEETASACNAAKRIVAVGTTSARVLESRTGGYPPRRNRACARKHRPPSARRLGKH